jgi:hypothetical protein
MAVACAFAPRVAERGYAFAQALLKAVRSGDLTQAL